MKAALQSVIRDLHLRRGRERRGRTLIEGVRLVEEARAAGVPLRGAAVAPALEATTRGAALKRALEADGVALESVSDAELDQLAATEQPQGVVAVIDAPAWTLADLRLAPTAALLVLDGVQDPGNTGTMLRTAFALGAAGVIALEGTVELANPKVLRASMGAVFRLPVVATEREAFLAWAREHGVALWAADAAGEPLGRPARRTGPVAIAVGNEGAGVTPALASAAARVVAIPLAAGAESLNVGVAAGILLHELLRDAR